MRFAVLFPLALLLGCGGGNRFEDCTQEADFALKSRACTEVIETGGFAGAALDDDVLAIAYNNRGLAKTALKTPASAIEDLDQAIRLNPELAHAYVNRGTAWSALGKHRKTIRDLDQAIRLNPEYYKAYNNRGTAYANLGEHALAIKDFNQAIRIHPKLPYAYDNRGAAYKALGDFDQAFRDWEHAIETGGVSNTRWRQDRLKKAGHYDGALHGYYNAETRTGLRACVRDPACY